MNHVFQDYVTINNRIWFSSSIINGLFSADEESGQTEFVTVFPEEGLFQCRLYTEVYVYNHKLILIPYFAENITIYNILDDCFFQIKPPISNKERKYSPFVTVQYKNKIFIFNDYMQNMAVLNVNDFSIKMRTIPMREKFTGFFDWPIRCVIDDCAYMALENFIITVQMSSEQVYVRKIFEPEVQFTCVRYWKDVFWIVDRKSQLYTYHDGYLSAERKLKLLQLDEYTRDAMVKDIFFYGENIWILFHKKNYLIRLNYSTMKKETILYENAAKVNDSRVEYFYYNSEQQKARLLLQKEDRHRILDLNTGEWSKIIYKTQFEEIGKIYQSYIRQIGDFKFETPIGRGLDKIRLLIDIQNNENDLNVNKNSGRNIFQYLTRM